MPIVALTGACHKKAVGSVCSRAGMEYFLTKPFGKDSLYSVMTAALGTSDIGENYMVPEHTQVPGLILPSSIDSEVANRLGLLQDEYDVLLKQFAKEHGGSVASNAQCSYSA